MERIERSCEIGVPLRTAYNQWTQFEDFPRFVDDVIDVEQIDDGHLRCRTAAAGGEQLWDIEITEQVPDERLAWRSTAGAPNAGEVRFEAIDRDRTRLSLALEYDVESEAASAEAVGIVSSEVDQALEAFKGFVERRGAETGGWRGEVRGGEKTGPAGLGTDETPLPDGDPVVRDAGRD